MKHFETPSLTPHEGPYNLPGAEGFGKQNLGKMANNLGIKAKDLKRVFDQGQIGADGDREKKDLQRQHIIEDRKNSKIQKQFREMGPIQGGRRGDAHYKNKHTSFGDPRPADFQN